MEKFDLITIVLSGLTLLLVGLLWLRQSRSQQAEDRERSAQESGQARLEELLREQERVFRRELAEDRQGQERRFAELQRQITEDAGRLRTELVERFESLQKATAESLSDGRLAQQRTLQEQSETLQAALNRHREAFEQRQSEAVKSQQESLNEGINTLGRQVNEVLSRNTEELGKRVQGLTESTDKRLQEISGQVDKRLSQGFEKTTETFTQVLSHLTRIDEAQKKITELSSNVVSLQEVLADKRSRGAFGEVQLTALVRNLMPESSFALQYQLSNDKRVDCMLFLPEPTGNIGVDSKFPLESYRRMTDIQLSVNKC